MNAKINDFYSLFRPFIVITEYGQTNTPLFDNQVKYTLGIV